MKMKLAVTVTHRPNKGGKVKILTDVTVRIESRAAVAFATLGGRYTAEQALTEFKKNPAKFTPQPGHTSESVALVAKAA